MVWEEQEPSPSHLHLPEGPPQLSPPPCSVLPLPPYRSRSSTEHTLLDPDLWDFPPGHRYRVALSGQQSFPTPSKLCLWEVTHEFPLHRPSTCVTLSLDCCCLSSASPPSSQLPLVSSSPLQVLTSPCPPGLDLLASFLLPFWRPLELVISPSEAQAHSPALGPCVPWPFHLSLPLPLPHAFHE